MIPQQELLEIQNKQQLEKAKAAIQKEGNSIKNLETNEYDYVQSIYQKVKEKSALNEAQEVRIIHKSL